MQHVGIAQQPAAVAAGPVPGVGRCIAVEGGRTDVRQSEFVEHSKLRRQILLDDLEGTAHRAYGMLPNMTWIIGRGGMIHYKSAWTSEADVVNALEGVLAFQASRAKKQWVAFYSERVAWSPRDMRVFKAGLERNGPQAVADYERMIEATKAGRTAPSEDVGPRIPGNYYKTEDESGKR